MVDLDIELKTTGIPFKNLYWQKAPAYPYGIYDDVTLHRGDDEKLRVVEHNTSLELYSEKIDANAEKKIEEWLEGKGFEFEKNRYWIESEKHFQTVYDFEFIEKKGA